MQYREYQSLEHVPTHCSAFMAQVSANNLYLSELWFDNIIKSGLETDATVKIVAVEDSRGEVCHALLFLRAPAGQNGSKFSHWNLKNGTIAGLTNFQTSFFALLCDESNPQLDAICSTLVQGLLAADVRWHMIDLNLQDPSSKAFAALQQAFTAAGFSCVDYLYKGNWYERLECTTFDEYLQARTKSSKKAIQNYQRKYRKLEKNGQIRIDIHSNDEQMATLLEVYEKIYSSSWKVEDFFPEFYPELIRRCALDGSLRMVIVYMDDQPVAFEFAIVTGSQCVMMRTAYVSEFARDSVGSIAIFTMIDYVIEKDRVNEIDFGTDDDPYKSTWVSQRRERHGLVFFNRKTIAGNTYYCRLRASALVQSWTTFGRAVLTRLATYRERRRGLEDKS